MGMVWSDKLYGTGVEHVDREHKELFQRINALLGAMSAGSGREEAARMLVFLDDYVVRHFAAEEKTMAERNCPAAAANKAAHDHFLKELRIFKVKLEVRGPSDRLAIEIQKRMCTWLRNHIQQIDRKLLGCTQHA